MTDFFPQIRLSTEERRWYVSTGKRGATALWNSMKTLDWKKTMEKDGVTYAQAHCIEGSLPSSFSARTMDEELQASASACMMMSATAFAVGTIGEALEALASPVTEDYRRAMHFLHGPRFVDGVCLHTITGADSIEAESNTQVLTTVKWAAYDDGKTFNLVEGPVGTDYCFLEHSGIHYCDPGSDANEVYGYSVQESISREGEVPSLSGAGLARGHFHRTGLLILPTDRPDVVQITSILQMRMSEGAALSAANNAGISSSEKTSSAALARLMCRRVAAIGKVELLLERRRLTKLVHLPRAEWIADTVRKACAVCQKHFKLRRRKHHCRHCGEVVCASCAPTREVDTDTDTTTNVRICTACVVQSRLKTQASRGYGIAVNRLQDIDASPTLAKPTLENRLVTYDNNAETITRPLALSFGSSTFSISSDSQISARLTRAGCSDGATGLFKYEDDVIELSSSSSSSYSHNEFDSFDSIVSISPSNQDNRNMHSSMNSQWSTICSPQSVSHSSLPSNDLLERIQAMKADLSMLTNSRRHVSDANHSKIFDAGSVTSVYVDTDAVTPRSAINTLDSECILYDARIRREGSSDIEGSMDIDYIDTSEQFTLLCPQTLGREWRKRTNSCVHQDPGEKSQFSSSPSSMSFVSTLSNLTMLGDEESSEQRKSQNVERGEWNADERGESQAELVVLRQQIVGLHRSLATATSQLDSMHSRRAPNRLQQQQVDPVAARHHTNYGQLVEELHEIMGLPRPGRVI